MEYWDGTAWREVKNAKGMGTRADMYNTTTFDPVSTTKIRLQMVSSSKASTGILEWKVIGIAL